MRRSAAPLALLVTLAAGCTSAPLARLPASAALAAGPMLGHVTHRTAVVWVQTAGPAVVALGVTGADTAFTTPAVAASTEGDHVARFTLEALEPGTRYAYRVLVNGAPAALAYETAFTTQALWQWRTDPPAFTVAIGSCFYANDADYDRPGRPYGGGEEIFAGIHRLDPDVMLWLGDNVYLREVDWWSAEGIAARYRHARALPELQPLLASAAHYATWDDHDYGPNDSDRSYVLKGAALETFRRYWANPSYGLPGVPGVFGQFQWGDAEFFLLDDRFHRAPNGSPDSLRTILGEAQMAWLLDALTASRAPFKLVAIGGQVLNPAAVYETYANVAPIERERLLAEIVARGIEGVVFLSGDRHHTELMRMERPGLYPLYEFTSSPLTSGPGNPLREGSPEREQPTRIGGTLVVERNFGTLSFSGPRDARVLTLRTYNTAGALLWERAIPQSELRLPREDD